jgi:siroheme synthase-like protein
MVDVRDQRIVVAGVDGEAAAKARTLAGLGARVDVWTPDREAAMDVASTAGIRLLDGPYEPAILDGARLAIVATGDRDLDHRIADDARARSVLVNTVDDIPYCDWSAPAVLRRGDLTVAIATAGAAPALAVRLRDQVREVVRPEHGALLDILAAVRPRIQATGRPFADRRRLWYELVDGPALGLLRAGDWATARQLVDQAVDMWAGGR